MFAGDAAQSVRASFTPDIPGACDSVGDILAEPFLLFRGTLPRSHADFGAVCKELLQEGMAAAGLEDGTTAAGAHTAMVETLRLVAGDENRTMALRAICYLRLLGAEGRSFQEIGDEFGVVRATVQEIYSEIQKRHEGLRGRGDKSTACREACRKRRLGFVKVRPPWQASKLWKIPPLSPLV